MSPRKQPSRSLALSRGAARLGLAAALLGPGALLAQALAPTFVTRVFAGIVPVQLGGALGLALLGVALAGLHRPQAGGVGRALCRGAALAALGIGLAGIATDLMLDSRGNRPPILSAATGAALVFAAAAVLLAARGGTRFPRPAQAAAACAIAVVLLVLLGVLYDAEGMYRVPGSSPASPVTVLGAGLLAAAVLVARPQYLLARVLAGRSPGAEQLRRALPISLAIPFLSGLVAVSGERAGYWSEATAYAVFTLFTMSALCLAAALGARRVDALALERQRVEGLFRRTFENAAVGFAHLDREGRWLRVNDRLCEIIGWSREELLSRTFQDVTHPDDLALDERVLGAFLRGEIESEHFEKRYLTKQGHPIWAEVVVSAERDTRGRVAYFVAVIQDISARKRAETELGLARGALDSSSEGVLITDAARPDEPIVYVNPAFSRITGYASEEVIGRNCRFLNEGDREQPGLAEIRRALRAGESATVLLRNVRKDGRAFWNELRISPVTDPATGTVTHHVGIQQDVSERVAAVVERDRLLQESLDARAEAERAGRAKDDFFALVSHELRSPLAGITGWLAVLRRDSPREVRARALGTIERSAALLARLIGDLLDASRIASGKLEIERDGIDLASVVQGAVAGLELLAQERRVSLELRGAELSAFVSGDAERLDQVVRNLIENALKFTPEGGHVEIVLGRSAQEIELVVRDTGAGIDAELLPHVFERFQQGAAGPRGAERGLGLGLSIVRHLVELHGGRVSAASEGRGRGASFRVTLPASPLPRRLAARRAPDEPDALVGVRVLLLEPDRAAAEALALLLEEADAHIVWARTPEEALTQAETRLDVVLADLDRLGSVLDGLPAALRTSASASYGRIAAVALSTVGTPAARRRAREAGFDAHLEHPVSGARLVAQIRALISSPRRVLVVDDDQDAADSLAILLARQGFEVERAYDAAGALAVAESFAPSAVVTDVQLGSADGISLARALRARTSRDMRIIAATGRTVEELGADASLFDAVLRKPVDLQTLLEWIRGAGAAATSRPPPP